MAAITSIRPRVLEQARSSAPPPTSLAGHLNSLVRAAMDAHYTHCLSPTSDPSEHPRDRPGETFIDRLLCAATEVRSAEQALKRRISVPIAVSASDPRMRQLQGAIEELRSEAYDFLDHVDHSTRSTTVRALAFARDFGQRLVAFERDIDIHLLVIGNNFVNEGQSDLDRIAARPSGGNTTRDNLYSRSRR